MQDNMLRAMCHRHFSDLFDTQTATIISTYCDSVCGTIAVRCEVGQRKPRGVTELKMFSVSVVAKHLETGRRLVQSNILRNVVLVIQIHTGDILNIR